MKYIFHIINSIFILLMLGVALLFIVPLLPIEHNIELRIVESGSMEPNIMTGAVVLIVPQQQYGVGEVVTFNSKGARVPTTHRIVDVYEERGQTWFVTKGDANEEADTAAVAARDVMGTVFFDVPYAGYILDFSRQPLGFFFLIVIPALMIIFGEVEKIWAEVRRKKGKKETLVRVAAVTKSVQDSYELVLPKLVVRQVPMMDIANPVRYQEVDHVEPRSTSFHSPQPEQPAAIHKQRISPLSSAVAGFLFAGLIIASNFIPTTISYFNDKEGSFLNGFGAVALDFAVLPDGEVFSFVDGELSGDDDGAVVTVVAPETGSVAVRYDLNVEVTGGDPLFCDVIEAATADPFVYDGTLPSLTAEDVEFFAPWALSLSLLSEEGLVDGALCNVNIVYTGWHYDEEADQGYFDEERTPLSFTYVADQPAFQAAQFAPLSVETVSESAPTEEGAGSSDGGSEVIDEADADTTVPEEEPLPPAEETKPQAGDTEPEGEGAAEPPVEDPTKEPADESEANPETPVEEEAELSEEPAEKAVDPETPVSKEAGEAVVEEPPVEEQVVEEKPSKEKPAPEPKPEPEPVPEPKPTPEPPVEPVE